MVVHGRHVGDVLAVSAVGLVTVDVVRGIREWMLGQAADAKAIAVDYTGAALALTDADLDSLAAAGGLRRTGLPMAWAVADADTAALWRRQIVRYAFRGQRRHVTQCFASALAWASAQAIQSSASAQP